MPQDPPSGVHPLDEAVVVAAAVVIVTSVVVLTSSVVVSAPSVVVEGSGTPVVVAAGSFVVVSGGSSKRVEVEASTVVLIGSSTIVVEEPDAPVVLTGSSMTAGVWGVSCNPLIKFRDSETKSWLLSPSTLAIPLRITRSSAETIAIFVLRVWMFDDRSHIQKIR